MIKYYFLKIVQAFVLPPGVFIVFLFLASLYEKRFKKFFLFLTALTYIFTTQYMGNILIKPLEDPYMSKVKSAKCDAVVVLGGGYYKESPNLPLSPSALKRFVYGLNLASEKQLLLIYNGAKEESDAAKKTLYQMKKLVKEQKVIFIDKALNTADNAKLTKEYFEKQKITSPTVYLVTSAYHMNRAKQEFEKAKIKVIPAATDFKRSDELCYCYFFPSADGLKICTLALHEYLAKLYHLVKS